MTEICSRCILDLSIPGIQFDENGECNFCKIHDDMEKEYPLGELENKNLNNILNKIKKEGQDKDYDCIIGVSGGTDSTYLLYLPKKLGLRPLAVHFDNGWNSEIAVSNIKNAISKLDIDLHTVVMDWEEFKDIQKSFFKASVPDIERTTDVAIMSSLYKVATDENIRYILSGNSFRTEGTIPLGWGYGDGKYIESIQKIFGEVKLKSYPNLTITNLLFYNYFKKIKIIRLLNYVDYSKEKARQTLETELGWKYYGGHHYESIIARFIYGYILPTKFNIDKRKITYSAAIRSNHITREYAISKINEEPYPKELMKEDFEYVRKKLDFSKDEFNEVLSRPPKTFLDYPSYYPLFKNLRYFINLAYKLHLSPVYLYEKYHL